MFVTRFCIVGMLLSVATSPAAADTIPLFNTGVNAAGTASLPVASQDSHWTVTLGATTTQAFVEPTNPAWVTPPNPSAWVWATANGTGLTNQPYAFRQTFTLPTGATGISVAGRWAADNGGSIFLNGVQASSLTHTGEVNLTVGDVPSNYNTLHNFSITSGFAAGTNVLEFRITDVGNPGGLLVSNLTGSFTPVPEPAGVGVVAATTWFAIRRRRRHATTKSRAISPESDS